MTDEEIKRLKPGDRFTETYNGRTLFRAPILSCKYIQCVNESSGAYGHWAAHIICAADACHPETGSTMSWSIESDEYKNGLGYPTHDKDGKRIRGCELIQGDT